MRIAGAGWCDVMQMKEGVSACGAAGERLRPDAGWRLMECTDGRTAALWRGTGTAAARKRRLKGDGD